MTIGLADGFLPRIDHVVDVSSDSSTNYRYVVFVSTGKPSSGVEMYYADINTAVNSVSISSVSYDCILASLAVGWQLLLGIKWNKF